jgi:hypothetical protein
MQLMSVFVVLLLVAVIAGAFMSWSRRSGEDRRHSRRGGRRNADDAAVDIAEPTSN